MEALSLGQVLICLGRTRNPIYYTRRIHSRIGRFRFRLHSKRSDFDDFQGYAKPSCLLPASEVRVFPGALANGVSFSMKEDGSGSIYRIGLRTSNAYGSSLSDLNAGVLLCLIDEDGKSILQRIPASLMADTYKESGDAVETETFYFQRGSLDQFTFEGPQIGRVEAIWISIERGQWRLGNVSLTVIHSALEEDGLHRHTGQQYDFQNDDILLSEATGISIVELRPSLVTELSGIDDPFTLHGKGLSNNMLSGSEISNKESMKEYANLKFSLLFYDVVLIIVGTSVASLSSGENSALAFLFGGICGFLYLILLQRSVDGLSATELISKKARGAGEMFEGFKGPVLTVALAVGITLLAAKYSSEDVQVILTPKDLIIGMMGFLACKVAVVLASFKPIGRPGLKSNR